MFFSLSHKKQKIVKQDILEQCNAGRDWKTIIFSFFMLLALCASGATYFFFTVLHSDARANQTISDGAQLIKREALDATLLELKRRSDAFANAPMVPVTIIDPSK